MGKALEVNPENKSEIQQQNQNVMIAQNQPIKNYISEIKEDLTKQGLYLLHYLLVHGSNFIEFDICSFYPSIGRYELNKALCFAKNFSKISLEDERKIFHSCRSILPDF